MNELQLFDDDIFLLLSIIVERNKLANVRSKTRGKVSRLRKKLQLEDCSKEVSKILKAISLAEKEYRASCVELASFTKSNKAFRLQMRKKYKTKQRNDASNEVESIALTPPGWDTAVFFCRKDFTNIVLDNELNDIILGVQ